MSPDFDSKNGGDGSIEPAPSAGSGGVGFDASRRRFARAGLAAPVVLGSLASKPVLAGNPAYNCTMSGQYSGNVSSHPGTVVCSTIGSPQSFWLLTNTNWPSAIVRGALPKNNCNFPSSGAGKGTVFNGFLGLTATFFYAAVTSPAASCQVNTTSSTNTASMYQVLASSQAGELFDLGRATVVSLLNAYSVGGNYPVTVLTIVAMFNATQSGGTYPVNSTMSWTRAQVITYLRSLYPPG